MARFTCFSALAAPWRAFSIEGRAKCPGSPLGPQASLADQWRAPCAELVAARPLASALALC
eukprot:5208173-Pyramimonas_sp.AAC.1